MKRASYIPANAALQITGIVFFSQLLLEMTGVIQRKPEYWWIVPAAGAAFGVAVLYSIAVVIWNARIEYQQQAKP
jgi:uncharacterized YccA/Bax inhibitor family protein